MGKKLIFSAILIIVIMGLFFEKEIDIPFHTGSSTPAGVDGKVVNTYSIPENPGWLDVLDLVKRETVKGNENGSFARDPLVYISAFWKEIVNAPSDSSFFTRIIKFLLAVKNASQ